MTKAKFKIRRGDQVVVISGREKGRTGEVREVQRTRARVIVQGVNMVFKHTRATKDSPGKIDQIESPLHISNVALVAPNTTNKPTRVGFRLDKDKGEKTRIARASGEVIAAPRLARDLAKSKKGKEKK